MKIIKKALSLLLSLMLLLGAVAIGSMSVSADDSYSVGSIIEYGSYPQSRVTDEAVISELNAIVSEDDFISYGYYEGDGNVNGSMVPGDCMKYADVETENGKYRAVLISRYRPSYTCYPSAESASRQKDNGYTESENYYWFKYEPIQWRVLDPQTGLVICNTVIDSQPFTNYASETTQPATYNSYGGYASEYLQSDIRSWLNSDFYNTAFPDTEKDGEPVFLLSYDEARNSSYGFAKGEDAAKQLPASDYAKCQGLYVMNNGFAFWRLCTDYTSGKNYTVLHTGNISVSNTYDAEIGIVPAMRLDIVRTEFNATFKVDGEIIDVVTFTVGDTSIDEPDIPNKPGYNAAWEEYTLGADDIVINAVYDPVEYTATFMADGQKAGEIKFTVVAQSFTYPSVPPKEGYTGEWEEYTLGIGNIIVNAVYTPIEYIATFVDENGEIIAEVPYTVKTEKIDEPAVPEKEGFKGAWEEYELTVDGITVKPVYEENEEPVPENLCKLDNENHGDTFCGKLITFIHNLIWYALRFIGIDLSASIVLG